MGQGHGHSAHSLERAGPMTLPVEAVTDPGPPGSPRLSPVLRAAGGRDAGARCRQWEGPGGR